MQWLLERQALKQTSSWQVSNYLASCFAADHRDTTAPNSILEHTWICFGLFCWQLRLFICQTMRHYQFFRTLALRPLLVQKPPQVWHCFGFLPSHQPIKTFKHSSICAFSSSHERELAINDDDLVDKDFVQDVFQYKRQSIDVCQTRKDVVVIMARQKAGPQKKTKERGQFLMDETITLTESISGWKVVGSHMISTANENSTTIFGKTNLQYLKEYVESVNANSVVFARDIFTPRQHYFFQDFLNVEVIVNCFYLNNCISVCISYFLCFRYMTAFQWCWKFFVSERQRRMPNYNWH